MLSTRDELKMKFQTFRKILICVFFLEIFCLIETTEVTCEKFENIIWVAPVGLVKNCYMTQTTSIDERNVTISNFDDSVKALKLNNNKKNFYLPVQIDKRLPNILAINAAYCSIKEIFKDNFNGLDKLIVLLLENNQIEKIPNDVFKDLKSLEQLWLRKKKLC